MGNLPFKSYKGTGLYKKTKKEILESELNQLKNNKKKKI